MDFQIFQIECPIIILLTVSCINFVKSFEGSRMGVSEVDDLLLSSLEESRFLLALFVNAKSLQCCNQTACKTKLIYIYT